jgi:hypothetical protein
MRNKKQETRNKKREKREEKKGGECRDSNFASIGHRRKNKNQKKKRRLDSAHLSYPNILKEQQLD